MKNAINNIKFLGDTKPSEDKKIIPNLKKDTINAKDASVTDAKDADNAADAKDATEAVDAKDATKAVDARDAKIGEDIKGVTDVQGSKNIKAEIDTKVGILIKILSIILNMYL